MKIIIGPRGSGKTTELIKLSHEHWLYIICSDPRFVAQHAQYLNIDIPQPLTYRELINKQYYGPGIRGFLIDNLDLFFRALTGHTDINAITISSSDLDNSLKILETL